MARTLTCSYRERGRKCRKKGTGNPPLCAAHRTLIDDGDQLGLEDLYDEILDRVDGFAARMQSQAQRALHDYFRSLQQRQQQQATARREPPRPRQRKRPPPPPRKPPPTPPQEDPREVLGFSPDAALTRQLVKDRQRKLANLFHPDKGGSTAAMQRINQAAETLLGSLSS